MVGTLGLSEESLQKENKHNTILILTAAIVMILLVTYGTLSADPKNRFPETKNDLSFEITPQSSFKFKKIDGKKMMEVNATFYEGDFLIDSLENSVVYISQENLSSGEKMPANLMERISEFETGDTAVRRQYPGTLIWHDGYRELVW